VGEVLGEPHNKKTIDKIENVNSSDKGGNSAKYRIAKLKQKLGLVELAKSVEVLNVKAGRPEGGINSNKIENVTINRDRGNSAKYRIAKLKRRFKPRTAIMVDTYTLV